MTPARKRTVLCAVIQAGTDAAACERLSAALAAASLASIVIAPVAGRTLDAASARPLVELAQSKGVAALVDADASLARTLRADGVQLRPSAATAESYAEARDILGGRAIVGADAGSSRHDAMTLAEAGADFIAFGLDSPRSDATEQQRLDLVAWWAEIFEIPVVALDVERADEAESLARAGADFICVPIAAGRPIAELQSWLGEIADAARIAEHAA